MNAKLGMKMGWKREGRWEWEISGHWDQFSQWTRKAGTAKPECGFSPWLDYIKPQRRKRAASRRKLRILTAMQIGFKVSVRGQQVITKHSWTVCKERLRNTLRVCANLIERCLHSHGAAEGCFRSLKGIDLWGYTQSELKMSGLPP